jgi:serine/threonine protein phosphatase PrpC
MSIITPLEPGASSTRAAPWPADLRHAVHTTLFGRIACAVASTCGSLHAVNEDAHSDLVRCGTLFVVADGVGGGAMAAMASRGLVSHLHASLVGQRIDADAVSIAMLAADRVIAERIAELTQQPGAATVALCAPVNAFASRWLIAWVGDCRVYQCSRFDLSGGDPVVRALSRDDTFEHLDEVPPPGGALDDPARMVGNGAVSHANIAFADLAQGDMLLVCSDGVHKFIPPEDWQRLLTRPRPPLQHCEDLVALARANGSTDDATALIVRREAFAGPRAQWLRGLVHPDRTPR